MPSVGELFMIVSLMVVGMLGVTGLLVVYVARIVKYVKQTADALEVIANQPTNTNPQNQCRPQNSETPQELVGSTN